MKITLIYFEFRSGECVPTGPEHRIPVEMPDGTDVSELCRQLNTQLDMDASLIEYDDNERCIKGQWISEGPLENGGVYSISGYKGGKYKHQYQAFLRKLDKFKFDSSTRGN